MTNLFEFIENLNEEKEIDKKRTRGYEILTGVKEFEANMDSYKNIIDFINYAKKNKDDQKLRGLFKRNTQEVVKEIEKIVKKFGKDKVEKIAKEVDGNFKGDEKKLFDFVVQLEGALWQKSYGNTLAKSGTRGNLDAATITARSFNIIPVKITINKDDYYGIMRAPDGMITFEKKIDFFNKATYSDKFLFGRLKEKFGKQYLNKLSDDELEKLINKEEREIDNEIRSKYKKIEQLPSKKIPLIKEKDRYVIEKTKDVKDLIDNYNFKFVNTKQANKKILDTIISIMRENKQYKDKTPKEIAEILKRYEVRTWAINNVKFWKVIRSFF